MEANYIKEDSLLWYGTWRLVEVMRTTFIVGAMMEATRHLWNVQNAQFSKFDTRCWNLRVFSEMKHAITVGSKVLWIMRSFPHASLEIRIWRLHCWPLLLLHFTLLVSVLFRMTYSAVSAPAFCFDPPTLCFASGGGSIGFPNKPSDSQPVGLEHTECQRTLSSSTNPIGNRLRTGCPGFDYRLEQEFPFATTSKSALRCTKPSYLNICRRTLFLRALVRLGYVRLRCVRLC
jgi:hypothetical protein